MQINRFGLGVLLVGLLAGCGGREYGWEGNDAPQKVKDSGETAKLEAEVKAGWATRDDEPTLRKTLAALEKLSDAKGGSDYATLTWLSRGYYLLGEMLEDTDQKLAAYEAGMRFGDRALNTVPAFREKFKATEKIEDACDVLGKEHIDAIYWDAVNLGKWAKAKGITKALFNKDKARKMFERVLALDETWFHGAAHRSLGSYHAALPGFAGRDLAKSKQHFDRAIALQPNYFATRVLVADIYAKTSNERRLYVSELQYVLKTPPESLPECAPENRVEQRKAKKLLDEVDEYFDEDEEPAAKEGAGADGGAK